jgi:hypothetical protein
MLLVSVAHLTYTSFTYGQKISASTHAIKVKNVPAWPFIVRFIPNPFFIFNSPLIISNSPLF